MINTLYKDREDEASVCLGKFVKIEEIRGKIITVRISLRDYFLLLLICYLLQFAIKNEYHTTTSLEVQKSVGMIPLSSSWVRKSNHVTRHVTGW